MGIKLKKLLRKGFDHKIFCEDYLYSFENDNFIITGVFDGCSTGIDSHFASSLSGKILKNVIQTKLTLNLDNIQDPKEINRLILFSFFNKLIMIKEILKLHSDEMLSTMILLCYNKHNEDCHIIALGDGVVCINGKLIVINEKNQPTYPIYYSQRLDTVDALDVFLSNHEYQWSFTGIEDVTISTDGLEQWNNIKEPEAKQKEVIKFIIQDNLFDNLDVMLQRKYNLLRMQGWQNGDDLGIIRLIKDGILEKVSSDKN